MMIKTDQPSRSHSKIPFFALEKNSKKLIRLVRERPVLYDYHIPHIKKQEKNQLWEEISYELNISVNECQKRWKNLRDTFNIALKNHRLSPKWKYAKDLAFLQTIYTSRKKIKGSEFPVSSPANRTIEMNVDKDQNQDIETQIPGCEFEEVYIEDEYKESEIGYSSSKEEVEKRIQNKDSKDNDPNHGLDEYISDILVNDNSNSLLISASYNNTPTIKDIKNQNSDCSLIVNKKYRNTKKEIKHYCSCVKEMDDIDLFLEFTNKKIRAFSSADISQIQKNIMDTIFEIEKKM